MKVLVLSPWLPWPPFGGALIRTFEILSYLSRRHEITLLAPLHHPDEADNISSLRRLCSRVITTPISDELPAVLRRLCIGLLQGRSLIQSLHYDPNLAAAMHRLTSRDAYDIIHVEFSFMATYLAYIDQESRAKKVLSTHNVESLRFARELRFARGSRRVALLCDQILFHSWETKSLRRFDGIAAVSESERAWIKRHAPSARVALIPNGVNTEYFSPAHERPSEEMFVVFTALMNYPPNIDAAQWFCRKILPIVRLEHPTLGFKIVGDKPGPAVLSLAKKQGVQVTGRVPDIRPYLNESLALVVPLRSGGGTRLKILEAMAMGRPVISTTQGAEGLKVTNGVNILLADTPEDFARHISALISDPQLGKRLGFAGRRLVEENYDWKMCLKRLEDFYRALLQRNPGKLEVAGATSAVEHPPDDEP